MIHLITLLSSQAAKLLSRQATKPPSPAAY